MLNYSWSSGETTPFIKIAPKKGGSNQEYQLSLTAGNNSNTGKVSVKSSTLELGKPLKSCVEDLLLPQPKGGKSGYEYSINGVDFQSSPLFSGIREGDYEFFVRDKDPVRGKSAF